MAGEKAITVLQINDTHGYVEPHPELFWGGGRALYRTAGGYARIQTIFREVRREREGAVIALDNGDTFHGTFPAVHSRGQALIDLVNRFELDAWTAHWDFAYGVSRLREIACQLNHPLVALNCYDKQTGRLAFRPFTVIERAGLRTGIIGIAATIIDKTMPPHFSEGLRFTPGNDELPQHIRTLREREKADLVLVLSHLGFPQDVKLAKEVPGIDVLLSGHTHNRMYSPLIVNGAIIIQSGCHGSFVGRLDLESGAAGVRLIRHQLITLDEAVPQDEEMRHAVDKAVAPHRGMLAEIVGHTDTPLHRNTALDSPMDDLLLQAIAEAAGTRIAFSNGWRYGAPVPAGAVTMNDLWNIIPTNPPVSVVELTGAEMLAMLEENLERTFAADPYRQMGGYVKRCKGVNVYLKPENPAGTRIQQLFAEDEPLDPARVYSVAFVTEQGVPRQYGRNRRDMNVCAIDALRSYLARRDGGSRIQATSVVAI